MTEASTFAALNDLLINLSRGLLQYVGESWPWTDPETEDEQKRIKELVQTQKQQVARLAGLLGEAEWPVDFGTYPTEYTDLHYVALSYLLENLVQNQLALVEDAKRVLPLCRDFPEARELVEEIQAAQQIIAHELKKLNPKPAVSQAKTI